MKNLIIISFFCQNLVRIFVQGRFMGNFFEEPNLHANLQMRNMRYMILFYSSSQSFPYIIQINISALEKESRMVLQLHFVVDALVSLFSLLVFLSIFHKQIFLRKIVSMGSPISLDSKLCHVDFILTKQFCSACCTTIVHGFRCSYQHYNKNSLVFN